MSIAPSQVAAVILAGGEGTRLHPLTRYRAKPAVLYGGRYRLIDIPISNTLNANWSSIFILAQHFSEELHTHIQSTYRHMPIQILTPQTTQEISNPFLGTADAVRKTLHTLLQHPAEYFLILSGDQLYNLDFREMLHFAETKQADLTIACQPIPAEKTPRMGLLQLDSQQLLMQFLEKPKNPSLLAPFAWTRSPDNPPSYLGSMGIYLFKRQALQELLAEDPRHDFGYHLIETSLRKGKTYGFIYQGYWEDIGTISSYYHANFALLESRQGLDTYNEKCPIYARPCCLPGAKIKASHITQSILCEGSVIEAAQIDHCIVGVRSYIHQGTALQNTVLMGNPHPRGMTVIGEECQIRHAIIDESVHIGNRVQLSNKEGHQHFDGKEGLFVRDGIIIVTAGTTLPDDFVF